MGWRKRWRSKDTYYTDIFYCVDIYPRIARYATIFIPTQSPPIINIHSDTI